MYILLFGAGFDDHTPFIELKEHNNHNVDQISFFHLQEIYLVK